MATARRGPELHSTAATGTGTEREPSPPVIGVGACGGFRRRGKAEVQRRDKGCARVGRTGQRQRFGGKRMRFSGGSTKRLLLLANLMAMPMRLGNRRPAPGACARRAACSRAGRGVGGSRVARDSRRKQPLRWEKIWQVGPDR